MKLQIPAVSKSTIHKTAKIQAGSNISHSTFGRYSYCGNDCRINNAEIGSFCSVSNNVHIGGAAHPMEFVSTSPVFLSHGRTSVKKKFSSHDYLPKNITTIGNDVWIGSGVFIKAGIKIGHGSVVGMGSVVMKDVPDYAIVAGNPAKIIRMRFSNQLIEQFLELAWWNWDDFKLLKYGVYFNDPVALIKEIHKK